MVTLQCIESLILLPTDKDNSSLNVTSESQHFVVVTNSGNCFLSFCNSDCFNSAKILTLYLHMFSNSFLALHFFQMLLIMCSA